MVDTRPATLTRKLLGEFLRNPETIKAFENLSFNSEDLADVVSAIQAISVLTLGLSDTFENERVVTSDGEVQLTDGGPGGNLTFGLSNTGVTAGSYGSPAHTLQIAINAKGRITLAQSYALNSDNVTEGATNLYFTTARARAALSGGTGISYNSGTGVIAVATNGVGDSQLRQSAAFSVIGRASNTTGDVGDITAASDGQVLRRSGSVLGFGAVDLSSAGGVAGILPASKGGTGVTANTGTGNNVLSSQPVFGTTLGVGGVAASATGAGVSFPATQSPSTDANTLDDYEEGTWTPTVTAGAGAITAYTASGYYTKIGRSVECTATIDITTNGTGADNIVYTLPFTAAAGPNFAGCGRETLATGNMLQAILGSGGSTATVFTYNNAYPGGTGYQLVITMTYFV